MPTSKVKAFFTGHEWCTYARRTYAVIDRAISLGCQEFICSLQPGFELEVAQILCDRNLPLIAVIPYFGCEGNYKSRDRNKFCKLFQLATKQVILYPSMGNTGFPISDKFARHLTIDWIVKKSEVCLSVCQFDRTTNSFNDTAADRAYHNNLVVACYNPAKCDEFEYHIHHKQLALFNATS